MRCRFIQKRMSLLIKIPLVILLFLIIISCGQKDTDKSQNTNIKKVGITQIASHPGLDELRNGVMLGLSEKGWIEGKNIKYIYKNANRDPNLTIPIAESFVKAKVDLIIPLTTPSSLAAAKVTSKIPIVFGAVTDPVGVGLVQSIQSPGGNISGTSDKWPFKASIIFFQKIMPELYTIGMLFSPGDNISEFGLKEMRRLAEYNNFPLL